LNPNPRRLRPLLGLCDRKENTEGGADFMSGTNRAKKKTIVAASFVPLILVSSLFGIYLAVTSRSSGTTISMNYPLTADNVNSTLGLEFALYSMQPLSRAVMALT
jgi:hypothetical protein